MYTAAVLAAWCRVSLHPLLERIGDQNKAKLQRSVLAIHVHGFGADLLRKLMYHYIDSGNLNEAIQVQAELSPSARKDILSNYLSYLLALRLPDDEAGQ